MSKVPTILIVDDEQDICESMKDMLEPEKYKVLIATNGVAGLKICSEELVDLIVLDLNMPRMDGYMFMEHMNKEVQKAGPHFLPPPVLILTGVDSKKDLGLAENLGASKFMNKPFKKAEFLAVIKELLNKS